MSTHSDILALVSLGSQSIRARPLPPQERRDAIVEATLPLLLAHGASITTRQIAEAAGIAEGTIFRVFPDKESLIDAAVEAAFDSAELETQLAGIDCTLDLDDRLVLAVGFVQQRIARIFQLMSQVQTNGGKHPAKKPPTHEDMASLIALIEPDRSQLRLDPSAVAHVLRGLTFACTHPMFAIDGPMSPTEIVSLALDGVRIHAPIVTTSTEHTC